MKIALPLIATFSLLTGGCGAETTYTSFAEVLEHVEESDGMTDSRAFGYGVGIGITCIKGAVGPERELPEGFAAVDLQKVNIDEYNEGFAAGVQLTKINEPPVCDFADAPWNN